MMSDVDLFQNLVYVFFSIILLFGLNSVSLLLSYIRELWCLAEFGLPAKCSPTLSTAQVQTAKT